MTKHRQLAEEINKVPATSKLPVYYDGNTEADYGITHRMNSDLINSKVMSSLTFFVYFQPMECTHIILVVLLRGKVSNRITPLRLRSRGM